MSKTHSITLSQGSVKYLRDMLSGVGWAKTPSEIIAGGALLQDGRIPDVDEPPTKDASESVADNRTRVKAWAEKQLAAFEVSEKEREAIKKCIKHFIEQGLVPATPQAGALASAFGLE